MENNKYYTPDISEFHIGFEFEYLSNDCKYHKCILGTNDINNPELYQYNDDLTKIAHAITRVKFLDRSDLEELGWEVIKEPYRWQFQHKNGRYKLTTDIYTSTENLPIPHPNSGSIKIVDNRDGDNYNIFNGYIKNKSELKNIMYMLDILEFKA